MLLVIICQYQKSLKPLVLKKAVYRDSSGLGRGCEPDIIVLMLSAHLRDTTIHNKVLSPIFFVKYALAERACVRVCVHIHTA